MMKILLRQTRLLRTRGYSVAHRNPDCLYAPASILQNIVAGRYKLLYKPYPSFLCADGSYDPEILENGYFAATRYPGYLHYFSSSLSRWLTVLEFLRHIGLGPKYAILGVDKKISKTCNTSLHNVKKLYRPVPLSEQATRDGTYNFEKLFNSLIKLFVTDPDNPEDVWAQELLDWCQQEVFGGATIELDSEAEKSPDEEDILAQRRRRRRAAAATTAA
ncbi:hypothetical protein R3P38DRAFT_2781401 [Favolaschia claudopus]|uniref:Uncharacterized protein n=1 Tax=Favolaschia claudopus TaxID=2862362 RepID=A0AAW0B8D5_9AGAR